MIKAITIRVCCCALALWSACSSVEQTFESQRRADTCFVAGPLETSVENAVISQCTLYPYHFAAYSASLNDLGRRDLNILASHFKEHRAEALMLKTIHKNVRVYFDYDKADIRADARLVLDEAAELLENNPKAEVLITGHADIRGSEEYNLDLGQQRAKAVGQYLQATGIHNRVRLLSRGELDALAPVSDEEGMQNDRNAHFVVAEVEGFAEPIAIRLNVRRGDVPQELYQARIKTVVERLEEAGIAPSNIRIKDGFPGGDGMPSEQVLLVLKNFREASGRRGGEGSQTTRKQ